MYLWRLRYKSKLEKIQDLQQLLIVSLSKYYKLTLSFVIFSVPTSLIVSLVLGWTWTFLLEAPDSKLVSNYSFGVVSFATSAVLVILSRPLYIVGQKCMFVKLKVSYMYRICHQLTFHITFYSTSSGNYISKPASASLIISSWRKWIYWYTWDVLILTLKTEQDIVALLHQNHMMLCDKHLSYYCQCLKSIDMGSQVMQLFMWNLDEEKRHRMNIKAWSVTKVHHNIFVILNLFI